VGLVACENLHNIFFFSLDLNQRIKLHSYWSKKGLKLNLLKTTETLFKQQVKTHLTSSVPDNTRPTTHFVNVSDTISLTLHTAVCQCYVFLQECSNGIWDVGPGQSGSWKGVLPHSFHAGEVGQPPPQH